MPGDEECGTEERGRDQQHQQHQQQAVQEGDNAMFEDGQGEDDEEEEETAIEVHSLEGVSWRGMRIGQQSARELLERVQPHHWPAMPIFSLLGIIGGGTSVAGTGVDGIAGENDHREGDGTEAWWRLAGGTPGARRAWWMVLGGVGAAVFLAVTLRGGNGAGAGGGGQEGDRSPLATGTPRHVNHSDRAGVFSKPSPLRTRLREVAETALAVGITLPMHTTFEIVRSGRARGGEAATAAEGAGGHDDAGGMDFIVSVISSQALEAKAAVAVPPPSAASKDPFDSKVLDPRMTVQELPPSHSLVLNKFNTMRNHGLIITTEFRLQEEALTVEDFSAWYRVVEELPAVGFYNSAVEAGASQRHKHMQVIPDDALWDYRPHAPEAIPVDEPISRLVGESRDLSKVWRIPDFMFQHAFALLPTMEELESDVDVDVDADGDGDGGVDQGHARMAGRKNRGR